MMVDLEMGRVGGVFLGDGSGVAVVLVGKVRVVPLVSQRLGDFCPLWWCASCGGACLGIGSRRHWRVVLSRQRLLSFMALFIPYVFALSSHNSC